MPLDNDKQTIVVLATQEYIAKASGCISRATADVRIHFNLQGAAAGQYRVRDGCPEIRYNPHIFARYFSDNLTNTVPHEVAHYIVDLVYGARNVKPHGVEWRQVMHTLDAPASRVHNYDLAGVPQRRARRYAYACNCREHELSSTRHNRVLNGKIRYFCRLCQTQLTIKSDRQNEYLKCINSLV
jgi:SprT protein